MNFSNTAKFKRNFINIIKTKIIKHNMADMSYFFNNVKKKLLYFLYLKYDKIKEDFIWS